MTNEDLKIIQMHHDKLDALEHSFRFADADAYYEKHRWAFDYDCSGNWVGNVSNENGITQH